jgi:transcriptional regulator with XRE-family HTH domain
MDQAVIPEGKIQSEATFLAQECNEELPAHTLESYEALLRKVAVSHANCNRNNWFTAISRYVTGQYGVTENDTQQIVANTALLSIQILQLRVGDVEEYCEIGGGNLAKLKRGQVTPQTKLTPLQLILLSEQLRLSLAQLTTDYTNQPEELRAALEAVVESVETKPVTPTTPAPETTTIEEEPIMPEDMPQEHTEDNSDAPHRLPERPPDPLLAQHIRAAIKQSPFNLTQVMQQTGIGNRAHLNQMERNKATLTNEQVQRIASLLSIPVEQLYSGEGLKIAASKQNALTVVGQETLALPPLSSERRQQFYRDLCLRRGVKIADGQDVGELLEAARAEQEVDWYELWLRVTEQGQRFQTATDKVVENTKKMGEIARADFLKALHQRLFPEEDAEE